MEKNGKKVEKSKAKESGNAAKCKTQASKKRYGRKRRFTKNQHTDNKGISVPKKTVEIPVEHETERVMQTRQQDVVVTEEDKRTSTSAKKIQEVSVANSNILDGFRLVDATFFHDIIGLFSCPECQGSVYIEEDFLKRKGLASYLKINCSDCPFSYSKYTSKGVENNQQAMEVNIRSVYAMRKCGVGHTGLQKFCGVMNMPPPVAQKSYDKLSQKLGVAVEKVAKTSMIEAAVEVKEKGGLTDVGVSFDGSWQRRGHSSLNGVGTAISVNTGKVLDCEVLSRHCKSCVLHAPLKETDPVKYEVWKVDHENNCQLNHEGSASSMESAAAVSIFSRSVENYGLRYLKYFGDGDSSSFSAVENVYPDTKVVKFECLGHYQKRVGNRLRKLRVRVKGLGGKAKGKEILNKTQDGRITKVTTKAKGKLTDHAIDMLQNYFGIALRSGAKTVPELKTALLASFFHPASSEGCNYHTYCPATKDSWCQYQRDLINGTNLYKPGKGFHEDVILHVKPEYIKLTDENELAKCLHGQTQNANESFNALI